MSKSPNIGLTLTPYSESSKKGILKTQAETISGTPFTWGMLKGGFSSPVTSEEDV